MKALMYEQHGGPEVLQYRDAPDPEPGPRDVVVKVAATTINYLDVAQRNGWFTIPGFSLPHISGMDVAGTVVEAGSEVTRVKPGDRALVNPSMTRVPRCFEAGRHGRPVRPSRRHRRQRRRRLRGKKCLAPETHLYPIPDDMTWQRAVVFPTCWMTAHHALFEIGRLKPGETALIHAAGSGRVHRRHPVGQARGG